MEPNLFHREDFYMVMLIRSIRNLFNPDGTYDPSIDLNLGLLRFGTGEAPPKDDAEGIKEPPKKQDKAPAKKDYFAGHVPVGPGTKSIFLGLLGIKEPVKDD